jgi:hypothetical protein
MPATQERATPPTRRRSVQVTGRKLASPSAQATFGLSPSNGVRSSVALMANSASVSDLLDTAAFFADSVEELEGMPGVDSASLDRVRRKLERHGVSHAVRPLPVGRLACEEYNGYPLQQVLLVVFNRDGRKVTAEFKEVSDVLAIRGVGADEPEALRDLERQFDELIRTKVRIPPHAREDQDEAVRRVVNHLVDWNQFEQENPLPRLLWGRLLRRQRSGQLRVHWLLGPGELRDRDAMLPRLYATPYFDDLQQGDWFRGVVREYPGRVEWLEPPARCPDPTDPAARTAAWEAIPRVMADQLDVWPLKGS